MSRLQANKNKKTLYQTIFMIVVFFGLTFFFFTYGFQILINGSLFINQLSNSSQSKTVANTKSKLNNIVVDPVPVATNSASFIFSGSLLGYDSLEIYLNDEKIKDINNISDSFSQEITGLEKGKNSIYAIAKYSQSKETKKSDVFTISYISEKPIIEIDSPKDGDKTNKEEMTIKGKTNKETFIQINSQPVVVDADGKFQFTLKLKEGENKIEIIASDIVDNQETKSLTIQYAKDD